MNDERLEINIPVSIKTERQGRIVEAVATILECTTCLSEDDSATISAIATDTPFLL